MTTPHIQALREEAMSLMNALKSTTLTETARAELVISFEETMALKDYLQAEYDKAQFLRPMPFVEEPPSPPGGGPVGAGGGLR